MRVVVINLSVRNISGGYEEYLNQFFEHVSNESSIDEILFLAIDPVSEKFRKFKGIEIMRISKLEAFLGLALSVKNKIRNFRPDIIYVPMEKRLKNLPPYPVVTLVQNMEPFVPSAPGNSLIWRILLFFMKRNAVAAIKHSDHVISLSNFACRQVRKFSNFDKEKISCVPHGIDLNISSNSRRPKLISEKESFIFTAGTLSPARGLEDLVNAFIHLKNTSDRYDHLKLCIAGSVHRFSKKWLYNLKQDFEQAGISNDVTWLGFIDREEVSWCFQNARAVVFTSRVESFCITAVEAMMHRATVISSTSPCLPETLENYAIYYESGNSDDLANKLNEEFGTNSKNVRPLPKSLISWDENFTAIMSIFNKLFSSNHA